MISLRIEKDLEYRLKAFAHAKGLSQSATIKHALIQLLDHESSAPDAFALGKDLFDIAGSGQHENSHNYKQIIRKKLYAKHSR
jgi:predicted transcriptional regulator